MKTVGHITGAISRTNSNPDYSKRTWWFSIAKRHFEQYAKSINKSCKVIGPFGLRSSFLVTLGRKTREFEISNHRGWHIGKRTSKRIHFFKPGTIGAMNGMGFEYVQFTSNTPLEKLFE